MLTVNKQAYTVNGKLQIIPPKTKASVRKLVLPPAVLAVLREYRKKVDSRWMFPSPVKADRPITPGVARRRLQTILERADCKRVRFHDLRHTFATLALENGMDVKTLSAMLGHVSAVTTLDIYTHITSDMQRAAAASIDRSIGKAEPREETEPERKGIVDFRPYVGKKKGEFKRTSNRHDYALKPTGRTALDALKDNGYEVISVGKIRDIFDGEGITKAYKSKSSVHGMEQTVDIIRDEEFEGLCFVNLVDFDALWGHRRNPEGYAKEVEMFDVKLGEALAGLREDDLLMITADHGNDPTYSGTDHTREQVPLLMYSKKFEGAGRLEETDTFAAVGATIAENFGVKMPEGTIGESILGKLV